jgi:hypothetical protein
MTDREKLIEILGENISEYCRLSIIAGTTKITGVTFDAYRFADHLIANGVTIPVRCKDCSFGMYAGFGKVMCDMYPIVEKANFYCAMGERKDNG